MDDKIPLNDAVEFRGWLAAKVEEHGRALERLVKGEDRAVDRCEARSGELFQRVGSLERNGAGRSVSIRWLERIALFVLGGGTAAGGITKALGMW